MISDVGCAALSAKAALECASLNVFVNTRTLKEDEEAQKMATEAQDMLEEYGPKAQEVADEVFARLRA